MIRVVGLDLSLTSTGVARLDVEPRSNVVPFSSAPPPRPHTTTHLQRVESKPTKDPTLAERSLRLRKLAGTVTALCAAADLVVVEGPSYASDSGKAHDRAGYWWMVVGRLTGAGLNVVEVPPSSLKTYATGKGNAPKDAVLAAVIRRYTDVNVDGNDCADALVLAAMGCRFAGAPIESTLPNVNTRAMNKIRWTP